ncbi:hypothetical protein EON83_11345 [bacterium]|nr:MAG: hypothetical protein EON83_11345 [bacterium]
MNDRQIEAIIQEAEKQLGASSFIGARLSGGLSLILVPFIPFTELGLVVAAISGMMGLITISLWSEAQKLKKEALHSRARSIWREIDQISGFDKPSPKERELVKNIARVYEHDPKGEVLPLVQAFRLLLAWKQQQKRLETLRTHLHNLQSSRAALLDKDRQLRELGDTNASLERALKTLGNDIAPLQRNVDIMSASCVRLESLVVEVDAAARRRNLHREVNQLTASLPSGQIKTTDPFDRADEHLDIERQIGREIETYLQLEREVDAHLRDL